MSQRQIRQLAGLLAAILMVCISLYKSHALPIAQTAQVVLTSSSTTQMLYPVTKVVDGDTVKLRMNEKIVTVRLIGLDTPEVVDPRKPVQCFGKEASQKAKEMLTGRSVRIEQDTTQSTYDKYGRLLAYIYLPDGILFNKYMIAEGYGHEYTYDVPYKFQKEFKDVEEQARLTGKGLWASGVCANL